MKRRDFLTSSAVLAGGMVPLIGRAQAVPCPPPSFGVAGGTTVSTACAAGSAEADWLARSTGPGVVWAHDFRHRTELDNFLWANTNKRNSGVMPRIATDGPTGHCLEYVALGAKTTSDFGATSTTLSIDDATYWPTGDFYFYMAPPPGGYPAKQNNMFYCPAGGRTGNTLSGLRYVTEMAGYSPCSSVREVWPAGTIAGHHVEQTWNRPFCAFASPGNGLPSNDVNNAGVTLRTWSPLSVTPTNAIYGYGWYGYKDYHTQYASWTPPGRTTKVAPWDGDEFYIQFRVKIDPRFWDYHKPPTDTATTWTHKLLFIQSQSTVPQQLVPFLACNNRYNIPTTRTAPFQWYTTQAGRELTDNIVATGSYQPGSQWAATAKYGAGNLPSGSAWEWVDGEWVTVLIHVKPGLDWNRASNPTAAGVRNTVLEVKVARLNQDYVTVYSVTNQAITYGSTNDRQNEFIDALPGYSSFIPTMYLNVDLGNTPPQRAYFHRFTQVIFSKQPVPAPGAGA